MSRARRAAALAAAGIAAAIGLAPAPAHAGVGWELEDVEVGSADAAGVVAVSGTIRNAGILGRITEVEVVLTRTAEAAGCASEVAATQVAYEDDDVPVGEVPPPEPAEPRVFRFDVDLSFAEAGRCNGGYTVEVIAVLDAAGNRSDDPGADDLESPPQPHVDEEGEPIVSPVAAPAAPARGVTATATSTRAVSVTWQPPDGYGTAAGCTTTAPADRPDFAGFVVERSIAGGAPAVVATIPSTPGAADVATCFAEALDGGAPAGEYAYAVYALRTGPDGATIRSRAASATVAVAPPGTSTTAATATTARPPRTGGGGGGVSVGGGRPSAGNAPVGTVPPVPDDGTFEETLDYDEEPGEEAAQLPDDAEAFLDFVPSPGPGILVPFAIAECLAVWAFHLRYLARRADDGF